MKIRHLPEIRVPFRVAFVLALFIAGVALYGPDLWALFGS